MVELRVDAATLDVQLKGGAPVLLLDLRLQATVALASVLAAAAARGPPGDAAATVAAVRGTASIAADAGREEAQGSPAALQLPFSARSATPASALNSARQTQSYTPLLKRQSSAETTVSSVSRMLSSERTCTTTTTTVLVGQGAPPPSVRAGGDKGTPRTRSTTPLSGPPSGTPQQQPQQPQQQVWRQSSAPSPLQVSSQPLPLAARPQQQSQQPQAQQQPRLTRVAQGQPPPPVAQRMLALETASPTAGSAGQVMVETRMQSARSSRTCSPSAAPSSVGEAVIASGMSEVREARSLSSHALMVLNDELQRISTGWHSTREEFKRRADGISAELDEQQKARASTLGELRDFQVQSQELIRRLNLASTGADQPGTSSTPSAIADAQPSASAPGSVADSSGGAQPVE